MKTSIIVITFNQLEHGTRPCLESVFRNTPEGSFELIIVDNGSTDGTADYLQALKQSHSNVIVQINRLNKGFAAGNNDGLRLASGDNFVLLNNDTLVPPGWLERLLAPLEADARIGLVGPVTNSVGNEQRIDFEGLDEGNFETLVRDYTERNSNVWSETSRLGFFCVGLRREVLERVGYLDERFGLGLFEDDDYCLRAAAAGYSLAVVEGCFVFHKGSLSFRSMEEQKYRDLFLKNRDYFVGKHKVQWGVADVALAYLTKFDRELHQAVADGEGGAHIGRCLVRFNGAYDTLGRLKELELGGLQQLKELELSSQRAWEVNARLEVVAAELEKRIGLMEQSRSWKITQPLRDANKRAEALLRKFRQARWLAQTKGISYVAGIIWKRARTKLFPRRPDSSYRSELQAVLAQNPGKPIIVFRPVVDWNLPLFQRPQHVAKGLADQGFLYFFCTLNGFDSVDGFVKVHEGCYVTNRFDLVEQIEEKKIIHVYAADPGCTWGFVESHLKGGDLFVYEYIDEIHADIAGREVPAELLDRHAKVLCHEDVICIASAEKLYRDVAKCRTKNLALVTNGVEFEHFSVGRDPAAIPPEIQAVIARKKPVIGYFGALAKWFDYELVLRLAADRPDYEILLIGWNYDHSIDHYPIRDYPNITVLGPIDYQVLPRYASWFDVSTIPFRINEVTESTSPIKLFEYMALGHPIVTTNMPECRKYRSVLIGRSHDEFIRQIDQALAKREDNDYLSVLKAEALENTWQSKASEIAALIRENLGQTGGKGK